MCNWIRYTSEVRFREGGLYHATGKCQFIRSQVSDNNKVIGTWYSSFRGKEEGEGEKEAKMEYSLDVYRIEVVFSVNRAQHKF
jgi:hypothetical protein